MQTICKKAELQHIAISQLMYQCQTLVWRKGNINKNCLCVTVVCTIIMVHKDMSSSYRSVDCIGL